MVAGSERADFPQYKLRRSIHLIKEGFTKDLGVLARGSSLAGIGAVLQKLSAFVIVVLQVRYLGLEKYGFKHVRTSHRNGLMGLEKVLPCFAGIYDKMNEFSQKGLLSKRIVQAISMISAPLFGYSALIVMRKR